MMIPHTKVFRVFGIFAVGLMLAGCDKCGDFYTPVGSGTPQTCQSDAPQPR